MQSIFIRQNTFQNPVFEMAHILVTGNRLHFADLDAHPDISDTKLSLLHNYTAHNYRPFNLITINPHNKVVHIMPNVA